MKLAYSTNGFTEVDLLTAIEEIARLGYHGVEILADAPHWQPGALDGAGMMALRQAVKDQGLVISNVNANTANCLWPDPLPEPVFEPSMSNSDADVRRRRIDYTLACLELASAIGAPTVSVASGRSEAHVEPERAMAFFAESLSVVCERAADLGVKVGIEYEPALLVERADEVSTLIEVVGSPILGVNLDIGHAICAFEDPEESIQLLAGRIWNVHVEDIKGRKHHHLVPGEGDIDFVRVMRALRDVGYDGHLTVELYTCSRWANSAAQRARAHLQPLLEQVLDEACPIATPQRS
ncbi:MAG: sugar phosphate isomerase/epimerase family protein [Bradymonadia bacterium]